METNPLVQALKTPIKATGCPSEGYVHSWIVFPLKPPPPPPPPPPPNPKFCKSPPPHTHITICHPRRESPASSFSLPPSPASIRLASGATKRVHNPVPIPFHRASLAAIRRTHQFPPRLLAAHVNSRPGR